MNKYDYSTAAAFAREVGYDESTVLDWIKAGKVKAYGRKSKPAGAHCKIYNYEFRPSNIARIRAQKPYPKHNKPYSDTEIIVLCMYRHLTARQLAEMIGRNKCSVKAMRRRLRRRGIL